MYRLTKAYRIWKDAPKKIQDATLPEDFAKGWELKFLLIDGKVSHFIHHVKQHFGMRVDIFCECCEFERWGL
jgi:hypothetical protein